SSHGIKSDGVSDAKKAFLVMEKSVKNNRPYDIVITDQIMPEISGEELCKKIRKTPELKDTIIILITSALKQKVGNYLKDMGFDGYLTKPVYPSDLIKMLSVLWSAKLNNQQLNLITRHNIRESIIS